MATVRSREDTAGSTVVKSMRFRNRDKAENKALPLTRSVTGEVCNLQSLASSSG